MKKIILSLFAMLFSISLNAQGFIQTTNTTGPNACDGSAYVMDTLTDATWEWYEANNNLPIQTGGYYLGNLCPGTYFINVTLNGVVSTQTFTIGFGNGTDCSTLGLYVNTIQNATNMNSFDGILAAVAYGGLAPYTYTWNNGSVGAEAVYLNPGTYEACVTDANGCFSCNYGIVISSDSSTVDCSGFFAEVSTTNTTSPAMCDGTATIFPVGGTAPYTYEANNFIINNGLITNLCTGAYYVIVSDANGCAFTNQFYIGTNDSINTNLYAYPYTTNVSAEGQCDGTVYFDIYGGVAPYTSTNPNGGTVTVEYITGLCEGVYSTEIMDANGNVTTVTYFIASPDNVIDNGGWNDTTTVVVDTLFNQTLEDCIIDYLSIDSAFISNIEFVTMDSVLVTWSVIDANGVIEILESYNLNAGWGFYEFILQVFCPQRAENQYLIVKQTLYLNGEQNTIAENNSSIINMYPNPVQDALTISTGNVEATITVSDITGKVVYKNVANSDLVKIDFSTLAKGQYVVNVSTNKETFNRIIIK